MTLPLNALRAFEVAARLGSFKAAAEALCVTQSAISHQIRHLEDWLGGPLFAREGNRNRLLDHGVELAQTLSIAFAEIERAGRRANMTSASQAMVIAAIPSVAVCWLIPRLSRLRSAHPDIEFRIVYAIHGLEIDVNIVHIAFVFSPNTPRVPNFRSEFFLSGASAAICAPALASRLAAGASIPAQLPGLGLLHDGDTTGWRMWMREMGEDPGDPIPGATFEDFNLLRAAALSGQGVALCPLAMIQPDLASGGLVRLTGHTVSCGSDYYLLSRVGAPPSMLRRIAVFRDWVMQECGRPVDDGLIGR